MRKIRFCVVLAVCCVNAVFAQTKEVTGKVTDGKDGSALPGVTVLAKNGTVFTTTANDGTYSLKVPQKTSVLTFSYVGYETVEMKIVDGQVLAVLSQGDNQLSEVIVTGFGSNNFGM